MTHAAERGWKRKKHAAFFQKEKKRPPFKRAISIGFLGRRADTRTLSKAFLARGPIVRPMDKTFYGDGDFTVELVSVEI